MTRRSQGSTSSHFEPPGLRVMRKMQEEGPKLGEKSRSKVRSRCQNLNATIVIGNVTSKTITISENVRTEMAAKERP
ncbi:hypothetical protein Nepgr_023273 [Nepenthes gracilis]|uniref:Uncharacterized protein n=1 Tax=Nepenthes gracilis TaxID=150966 RepID=A0AAD3T2J6_NEPGR|nr:hypothetical protein Nepgr_023273 [Nepenthes gracilis]